MASTIRKASVDMAEATGKLALVYADTGIGHVPVMRPFVGGAKTGLHYQPQYGDGVAVLCEESVVPNFPVGTVSQAINSTLMPSMQSGETAIYGPDGSVLSYATASGAKVLYRNAGNTLSITVDPATGRVNITATGGLWVNGTQVTVP